MISQLLIFKIIAITRSQKNVPDIFDCNFQEKLPDSNNLRSNDCLASHLT